MFQTWPIEALQSMGNEVVTSILIAVSALGYRGSFVPLLIGVVFAWDFRRGFWWLECVVGTALVTVALKIACSMPRPFDVSTSVRMLDPLLAAGTSVSHSFGFPSGHASVAVVLWGGWAVLLRRTRFWAIPAAIGLAVAFSRIYLGVHFVGDVLGGLAIGLIGLALFSAGMSGRLFGPLSAWLRGFAGGPMPNRWFVGGLVFPLLLLPWTPVENLATWIGLHVGFFAACRPEAPRLPIATAARGWVLLSAFLLFGVGSSLVRLLPQTPGGAVLQGFLPAFAMVWGASWISRRLSSLKDPDWTA